MFKGRHFDRSVILLCVRWYLAYGRSLRNLEEMMTERGIFVDHATIHRWVIRYSPELLERFSRRKRVVTEKWHVGETYIRVRGQWRYLYRAIDSNGETVDSLALDRRLRQEMQVELRRIQRESGLTTIFVTHDQEEALALSDSVAILDRGRIVQHGTPADIYERPRSRFAASFLGDANFFVGRVGSDGVETASGLVRVEDELPELGSSVTVAVRPEKMSIRSAEMRTDGENRIEGILQEVIFAGAVSTFILQTMDGREIKVFNQNTEPSVLTPGTRVAATWPRERTIVLEA